MQKNCNLYGCDQFGTTVICVGPEWITKKARLEKEKQLICSFLPEEVYNTHPNAVKVSTENYRLSCEIDGKVYQTIKEASTKTNESESQIRAKLKNGFPGYSILDKIKHGYQPIIANGKPYSSIIEAVNAGEAKTRLEATRKLKSLKHKDWNYQSPAKYVDKTEHRSGQSGQRAEEN